MISDASSGDKTGQQKIIFFLTTQELINKTNIVFQRFDVDWNMTMEIFLPSVKRRVPSKLKK